jgi:hypothetical protein
MVLDGVGGDEFGYVHCVGIGVVLDAGGRPERALRLSSEPGMPEAAIRLEPPVLDPC